jgi:FkbM family methyltransferase
MISELSYQSDKTMQQDRWVVEEVFPGRSSPGFYIEAGAADGVAASNTYVLETMGWTGILCEPNAKFFERLVSNRPKSICRRACLSDVDGEIDFIEAGYLGTAPRHVESTFASRGLVLSEHENYQVDADGSPAVRSLVPAIRLDTLLQEVNAPRVIDYLSLDLEGGEFIALSSFPFDAYQVLAMTIENHFWADGEIVDADHCEPVRALLAEKGYRLVQSRYGDDFFLPA